jgi:hypothetical protein
MLLKLVFEGVLAGETIDSLRLGVAWTAGPWMHGAGGSVDGADGLCADAEVELELELLLLTAAGVDVDDEA